MGDQKRNPQIKVDQTALNEAVELRDQAILEVKGIPMQNLKKNNSNFSAPLENENPVNEETATDAKFSMDLQIARAEQDKENQKAALRGNSPGTTHRPPENKYDNEVPQNVASYREELLSNIVYPDIMPTLEEIETVKDEQSAESFLDRLFNKIETLNSRGHAFNNDEDLDNVDLEAKTTDPQGDRQLDDGEEPDDQSEFNAVTLSDGNYVSKPPKGASLDLEKAGPKSGPLAFRLTEPAQAPQYGRTSMGGDSWVAGFATARGKNNVTPPQTKTTGFNMAMYKSIPRGGVGNVSKKDQDYLLDRVYKAKTKTDVLKYTLKAVYALSFTLPQEEYDKTGANKYQKSVLFVAGMFQFIAALNAIALRMPTGYDKDRYYERFGLFQRAFRKEPFTEMEYVQHKDIEQKFKGRIVRGNGILAAGVGILGILANLATTSPFKQAFESDSLFAQQFVGETIAKFFELFAGRDKKKKAFEALFAAARSGPQIAALLGYAVPGLGPIIGATQSLDKGKGLANVLWADTSAQVSDGIKNLISIGEASALLAEQHTGEARANLGKAVGQLWLDYFLNGTKAYDKHLVSTLFELLENYGLFGLGGWTPLDMINNSIAKDNQKIKEEAGHSSSVIININDSHTPEVTRKKLNAYLLKADVRGIMLEPENYARINQFIGDLHAAKSRPDLPSAEKILFDRLAQNLPTSYLDAKPNSAAVQKLFERLGEPCDRFRKDKDRLQTENGKLLSKIEKIDSLHPKEYPAEGCTNIREELARIKLQENKNLKDDCIYLSGEIDKLISDFERFYVFKIDPKTGTVENKPVADQIAQLRQIKTFLDLGDDNVNAAQQLAKGKPATESDNDVKPAVIDIKDKSTQTSIREQGPSSPSGTAPTGAQEQSTADQIPVFPITEEADNEPLNPRTSVPPPPPRKVSTSVDRVESESPLLRKGSDSIAIGALIAMKTPKETPNEMQIELQPLTSPTPLPTDLEDSTHTFN